MPFPSDEEGMTYVETAVPPLEKGWCSRFYLYNEQVNGTI